LIVGRTRAAVVGSHCPWPLLVNDSDPGVFSGARRAAVTDFIGRNVTRLRFLSLPGSETQNGLAGKVLALPSATSLAQECRLTTRKSLRISLTRPTSFTISLHCEDEVPEFCAGLN